MQLVGCNCNKLAMVHIHACGIRRSEGLKLDLGLAAADKWVTVRLMKSSALYWLSGFHWGWDRDLGRSVPTIEAKSTRLITTDNNRISDETW